MVASLLPSGTHISDTLTLFSGSFTLKNIEKLHKQFGHCKSGKLISLLKNAGCKDKKLTKDVEDVVNACETCQRYGRAKVRPKGGLPHATDFNQALAFDLHQLGQKIWYFHVIDLFTKFSVASIIQDKRAETILAKFLRIWVYQFGAPTKVLSDNGLEFNNEIFRDGAAELDIEVQCTAANSPFSNGVGERHNQTLTNILLELREDDPIKSWESLLQHALFAKNCLHNIHSISPYQLVYGRNPRLPNIFTHELLGLETQNVPGSVGTLLAFQNKCRKLYLEAENG